MNNELTKDRHFSLYLLIGLTLAMTVAMLALSFGMLDLGSPTLDSLPPIEKARTDVMSLNRGLPPNAWEQTETRDGVAVAVQSPLLFDIAPLKGLSIAKLDLRGTRVSDLSPLIGMHSLRELLCSQDPLLGTIEPLRGLKALERIDLRETVVGDLLPLMECPVLETIEAEDTLLRRSDFLKQHPNATRLSLNGVAVDVFFD